MLKSDPVVIHLLLLVDIKQIAACFILLRLKAKYIAFRADKYCYSQYLPITTYYI